ncbi:PqiC family protein [Photobacterium sp. J15]|uniref:PqiC family protein n=1 Tax=Photobacterium sp. J15 TaxID=265901 RepID=UPI0007E3483D|nr:PqiC family protein [Photobacterium sp. J15]
MSKSARYILSLLLMIFLVSCGSVSPPVHYYRLQPLEQTPQPDIVNVSIIGLGPFRVADYLKRSQIVTRVSDAEVKVDDFSRWSEPLDLAIHKVLATNIDHQLANTIVVAFPFLSGVDIDYFVVGQIDRFEADHEGTVVLDIQWGLVDAERQLLVEPRRVRYQRRIEKGGEMEAIVVTMNQILQQLSLDIANSFIAQTL